MTMYVSLTMLWSILAKRTGCGRFWPIKVVLVDFDWKKWFFDRRNGLWSMLAGKKLVFDPKKNWSGSNLAEKSGYGQF